MEKKDTTTAIGKVRPMETVVSFNIPSTHYVSEACNVFCTDSRFANKLYDLFFEQEGYKNPDRIFVAGGAKKVASPVSEEERQSTLQDIVDLLKLHDCRRINLGVHAGCGKYGKKFETQELEADFFKEELFKARAALEDFLKENDYAADIHTYFGDWNGMHEVKN